jgi:hypothetical protein
MCTMSVWPSETRWSTARPEPTVVVHGVHSGQTRRPGDEHERSLGRGDGDRGGRHHRSEQGDPGRAEGQQAGERLAFSAGAAATGVDHQLEAVITSAGVQPVDDLGPERVVQVGNHHAEEVRGAAGQRARHGVRRVPQFVGGAQHRRPAVFADLR